MGRAWISAAGLLLAASSATAQSSIGYVTDMPVYQILAPCVKSALSWNILSLTSDACPEAATELQACVCTKNNNLASISGMISSAVSYSCGATASDDQATAQSILSAYCDPDITLSIRTPTAVDAYITELPEISYLAPCAQSALMYAVRTMTYDRCPTEPAGLASCACSHNQNSQFVSQIINTSAKFHCSGNTADVSSAQAFFAAYCLMDAGTTSFPPPPDPPGDMTYYITDLPQYSSLAPCAADGLSEAVHEQSLNLCPGGPQALASCVCLKGGMTNEVRKAITTSVRSECASTATDDVSSAVAVFEYYCSAAAAEVTPAGVSNSVEQTYPPSRSGGGPRETGAGTSGGDTESSSSLSTGIIVGAAVGAVGGLLVLGIIVFFIVRSVRKSRSGSLPIPDNASGQPGVPLGFYGGKAELPSDSAAAHPPSPSPSTLKPAAASSHADVVSPLTAVNSPHAPPPGGHAELSPDSALFPPTPNRPELHSQPSATPPPPPPNAPELYGQGAPPPHRPELYGQGAPQATRPELAGQYNYPPPPPSPQHSPYPPPHAQQHHHQHQQQQQQHHELHAGYPNPYPSSHPSPSPSPSPNQHQHQQPAASWQSGPVPELHEMDGGMPGAGQRG